LTTKTECLNINHQTNSNNKQLQTRKRRYTMTIQKVTETGAISSVGISLNALKGAQVGDTLLLVSKTDAVSWMEVVKRESVRGKSGNVKLTLRSMVAPFTELQLDDTNTLPQAIALVRKVVSGINLRSLEKASVTANKHNKSIPQDETLQALRSQREKPAIFVPTLDTLLDDYTQKHA
jgi:hypothetical protein